MTIHRTLLTCVLVLIASRGMAQPPGATLISPSADVVGSTITFTWNSATGATWYQFWLGKADTSLVTDHWYTADHAGCATGATCSITLTPPLTAGAFIWHIRTWNSAGYGPWSPAQMFTTRDVVQAWSGILPPSRRFTLVLNNQAVLDNETGLVWQRQPSTAGATITLAGIYCGAAGTGARMGWRLPTLPEITSILEYPASGAQLPPNHPFLITSSGSYWTATTRQDGSRYVISFPDVDIAVVAQNDPTTRRDWCVRGSATAGR